MARKLNLAAGVGFGILTLYGALKIKKEIDDIEWNECQLKKIIKEKKLYGDISKIPDGSAGVLEIYIPRMTRPSGFVTICKQDMKDLSWKLIGSPLIQLGFENLSYSEKVDGLDELEKYLVKEFSKIGFGADIENSLVREFKIQNDCDSSNGLTQWSINHFSFKDNLLYFSGRKIGDTFMVDRISLSHESQTEIIVKKNLLCANKKKKYGYISAGIGLGGILCSALMR